MWAQIEAQFGTPLAIMLRAEARAGITLYLALTGTSAQREVFRAAARTYLHRHGQTTLDELLKEKNARAKERNPLVHGIWGTADSYPDALLLSDPARATQEMAELMYNLNMKSQLMEKRILYQQLVSAKIMIYNANDFIQIERRMGELSSRAGEFRLKHLS